MKINGSSDGSSKIVENDGSSKRWFQKIVESDSSSKIVNIDGSSKRWFQKVVENNDKRPRVQMKVKLRSRNVHKQVKYNTVKVFF